MPGPHSEEIRRCILLFLCTLDVYKLSNNYIFPVTMTFNTTFRFSKPIQIINTESIRPPFFFFYRCRLPMHEAMSEARSVRVYGQGLQILVSGEQHSACWRRSRKNRCTSPCFLFLFLEIRGKYYSLRGCIMIRTLS